MPLSYLQHEITIRSVGDGGPIPANSNTLIGVSSGQNFDASIEIPALHGKTIRGSWWSIRSYGDAFRNTFGPSPSSTLTVDAPVDDDIRIHGTTQPGSNSNVGILIHVMYE